MGKAREESGTRESLDDKEAVPRAAVLSSRDTAASPGHATDSPSLQVHPQQRLLEEVPHPRASGSDRESPVGGGSDHAQF